MIDVKQLRHRAALARGYEWEEMTLAPEVVDELLDRLEAAERERDALAAHLWAIGKYMEDQWPGAYSKVFEKFGNVSPDTSLDRLIAEKQAEIAERVLEIAAKYFHSHSIETEVEEMLNELRRQASGDSP